MPRKLTYKEVKSYIENQGYTLLSKEYKNSDSKLKIQCTEGHIYYASWNKFRYGRRCKKCWCNKLSNKKSKSFGDIKKYIESYGYNLLSTKYIDSYTKLEIKCPLGHIYHAKYNSFQQGKRCPYCANIVKYTYKEVKEYIELFGYTLLSKEYTKNNSKLKIQCLNGHIYYTSFTIFRRGSRCPICWHQSTSSSSENEIQQFIKSIYNGKTKSNDRDTIINPLTGYNLELDIYLPEINKAIEFNGTYWHSLPNNDKTKKEQCKNNNIDLLVIEEENWINNKEFCLQIIENFISL